MPIWGTETPGLWSSSLSTVWHRHPPIISSAWSADMRRLPTFKFTPNLFFYSDFCNHALDASCEVSMRGARNAHAAEWMGAMLQRLVFGLFPSPLRLMSTSSHNVMDSVSLTWAMSRLMWIIIFEEAVRWNDSKVRINSAVSHGVAVRLEFWASWLVFSGLRLGGCPIHCVQDAGIPGAQWGAENPGGEICPKALHSVPPIHFRLSFIAPNL
jgi:hypothetical protein